MDRFVNIVGVGFEFKHSLGCETQTICEVMRIGRTHSPDLLCYEVVLNGKQAIEFIKEFAPKHSRLIDEIQTDKNYVITAYDW